MNDKIKIYAVVGATASGKSSLALELARRYGGEIISCDSMQVYRKMNIGTAKPTDEEMARVRHHMIDVAEPFENFSCAEYVSLADATRFWYVLYILTCELSEKPVFVIPCAAICSAFTPY